MEKNLRRCEATLDRGKKEDAAAAKAAEKKGKRRL